MKKYIEIFILTVAMLLVFCIGGTTAEAAGSFTMSVSGTQTIRAGNTLTYEIRVNPGSATNGVAGFQMNVTYNASILEYSSVSNRLGSSWSVVTNPQSGTVGVVAYDTTAGGRAVTRTSTVITITFRVKSNVSVGSTCNIALTNVRGTDGNSNTASGSGGSLRLTVAAPLSTNCNLSDLSLDVEGLIPEFSVNVTKYDLTVPYETTSLKITYKTANSGATVSITGNSDFVAREENEVTITVTAESGAKKEYVINVFRQRDPNEPASSVNDLSSLSVNHGILSPAFNKDQQLYAVYLPFETESLTVTPRVANRDARVSVSGGEELMAGSDNIITVIVTAENGDKKTYTIIAKRGFDLTAEGTDNAYLASLSVEGAEFASGFDKNVFEYVAVLSETTENIVINAIPENENAVAELVWDGIVEPGMRKTISVIVTAPDGSKLVYNIDVSVRSSEKETGLASLVPNVGVLSPEFNETITTYTLTLPQAYPDKFEGIDFATETISPDSSVELVGIKKDEENGVMVIAAVVTAKNGDERIYTVTIEYGDDEPVVAAGIFNGGASVKSLVFGAAISLLAGIFVGLCVFMFVRRARKNRSRKHSEWDIRTPALPETV